MSSENNTHEVGVARTLDAPRERVWRACSDAAQVMRWWGPQVVGPRAPRTSLTKRSSRSSPTINS